MMRPVMNSVEIARPAGDVFDYCSDLGNEHEWNPNVRSIRRLSSGPLGAGSRFMAQWVGGPALEIVYTRFERPALWEAFAEGKSLALRFRGEVAPTRRSARLTVTTELRPKGLARLFGPLLRRSFQTKGEANLARLKARLERTLATAR